MCQRMEIPKTRSDIIELFKTTGKIFRDQDDLLTSATGTNFLYKFHLRILAIGLSTVERITYTFANFQLF